MPRVRRSLAALATVPLLTVTLAGCGGESATGTQTWYQAAPGANAAAGDLAVRNVVLVGDGEGTASLVAFLSNQSQSDDLLHGIAVNDQPVNLDQPIQIPAGSYASIGGEDDPKIQIDNLDVPLGRQVHVEFRFSVAPQTSVDALVVPAQGEYEELGPTPQPTATSLAPTPAPSPTATPTASPTPSPTPSS